MKKIVFFIILSTLLQGKTYAIDPYSDRGQYDKVNGIIANLKISEQRRQAEKKAAEKAIKKYPSKNAVASYNPDTGKGFQRSQIQIENMSDSQLAKYGNQLRGILLRRLDDLNKNVISAKVNQGYNVDLMAERLSVLRIIDKRLKQYQIVNKTYNRRSNEVFRGNQADLQARETRGQWIKDIDKKVLKRSDQFSDAIKQSKDHLERLKQQSQNKSQTRSKKKKLKHRTGSLGVIALGAVSLAILFPSNQVHAKAVEKDATEYDPIEMLME